MEIKSFAKINLSLYITGRKDGLHTLDTVIAPIDLYDIINISPSDNTTVSYYDEKGIIDIKGDTVSTIISKWEEAFSQKVNLDISIKKNIPMMAGLGGSSANAASVLGYLCSQNSISMTDNRVKDIAFSTGDDVYPMLFNTPLRKNGDFITPININTPLYLITAMSAGSSTAQCFGAFAKANPIIIKDDKNTLLVNCLENGDLRQSIEYMHNDLETYAININSIIKKARDLLQNTNPLKVVISGSGGAFFAIYSDDYSRNIALRNIASQLSFAAAVNLI